MAPSSRVSTPIDSNQLLLVCHKIRDNLSQIDKGIKITQLRLTTLDYIQDDIEDLSLKCIENLIELCNLSQLLVNLLDELHLKMVECVNNQIDYQIALQQLVYFTNEWHEYYTPRLNETLEWASRLDIVLEQQQGTMLAQTRKQTDADGSKAPTDTRLREALLRLKQSMGENERLLAIIASNIDYTRTTIEIIYESLQSTKVSLNAGERNTIEAIDLQRQSFKCKFIGYILLFVALIVITFFVFRLILNALG